METLELSEEDTLDRECCRNLIKKISANPACQDKWH